MAFSIGRDYFESRASNWFDAALLSTTTTYFAGEAQQRTGEQILLAVRKAIRVWRAGGVWPRVYAFWPHIGDTLTAHSLNLFNPDEYQCTFHASSGTATPVVGGGGISGNGSTVYANTHLTPATLEGALKDDFGIHAYSRSAGAANVIDMGAIGSGNAATYFYARRTGDVLSANVNNTGAYFPQAGSSALGLTSALRSAANQFTTARNGGTQTAVAATSTALPDQPLYLLGLNNVGALTNPSARQYAGAAATKGMSATELAAFYAGWQQLNTDLGRQV